MTYESQWKSVIDEEWEKYKTTWEGENPGEEPNETRLTFVASFMRRKYQEETEEVLNNVRKRRDEMKTDLEDEREREGEGEGEGEKNLAYQEYLEFHILLWYDNSPS
jgi:hypothetical protein